MLYEFFELIINDFTKSFNKELYDVDDIMHKIKLILNMKIGTVCKIMREGSEERREVSLFDQSQDSSLETINTPLSSPSTPRASEGGRKRRNTKRKKHKNGNKKQRKTKRRKN